jgi:hypothetical protein
MSYLQELKQLKRAQKQCLRDADAAYSQCFKETITEFPSELNDIETRLNHFDIRHEKMMAFHKQYFSERWALQQKHRAERKELAERYMPVENRAQPNIRNSDPTRGERYRTMEAVLESLGQDAPNGVEDLMTAYTQWLLTAKKTNQKDRPMNRWDLMTTFVETQLIL